MTSYFYSLYGLVIRSDLLLPEVRPANGGEQYSVDIVTEKVPERLAGAETFQGYMDFADQECLYRIPDVGRFLITGGRRIAVAPAPGADPKDVRAFLFGSMFGTLLHQRKLIPLHVSAVATPSGVVAFTGESGAGKSTLAATLNKMTGWPIFCDDVAVLREVDGEPVLESGMLRLKLWKDALERLDHDPARVQQDPTRYDKYHLDANDRIAQGSARMAAIIQLEKTGEPELKVLKGGDALTLLMNAIYRPYLVPMFNDQSAITQTVFRLLPSIEAFTYSRPWLASDLESSAEIIRDRFDKASELN